MSVDAVQRSGIDVVVPVPASSPVGTLGATVSLPVTTAVRAVTAVDAADTLPATSLARTENEYAVFGDSPVTVRLVDVVLPTSVVPWYTW